MPGRAVTDSRKKYASNAYVDQLRSITELQLSIFKNQLMSRLMQSEMWSW